MADDGTGFLSGIAFTVTDAAGAVAAAAQNAAAGVGGGGFTMSRDEMTAMLTRAQGTLQLITDQQGAAQRIAQIDPPGDDSSSKDFTNVAIEAGNSYLDHLTVQHKRYQELIYKLNEALGNTVATDDDAAKAIQQPGAQGEF